MILERAKGFEPSTPTLARLCSTPELRPRSVRMAGSRRVPQRLQAPLPIHYPALYKVRNRGGNPKTMRQMTMVGFLQAQNCTNFVGSWRHPKARQDFTSAEYYRRIGQALEAGKFHLGFFDDRLALPSRFPAAPTSPNGIRGVKMDPITVLTLMGMATQRLGLGATFSPPYFEPFHVARVFATPDLLTEGRAARNTLTS